jgi:polysaccharide export outer membrane protein
MIQKIRTVFSTTPGLLLMRRRSLPLLACALLIAGCATTKRNTDLADSSATQQAPCLPSEVVYSALNDSKHYVIQSGDELQISFYLSPEFDRDVIVSPDGKIALEVAGDLQARGLTPEQLANELDEHYLSELRNPQASVFVKNSPSRRVYVEGQVSHAGAFELEAGMTALQAVAAAGGVTDSAASGEAVLIRRDACGQPQGMVVNLAAADGGKSIDDVALMPSDVIVVPRSAIANVDLFVHQYIQGVMPIPPYLAIPVL